MRHPPRAAAGDGDSLRYWLEDMRVDGFRSTWRRAWPASSTRWTACRVLRPGDAGPGGEPGQAHRRALGPRPRRLPGRQLPAQWTEWTAAFAIACATTGAGAGDAGRVAERLSGSSDLYQSDGRRPYASVNFVTAHDGFTLATRLLQREAQRGNGEDNNDGESHNAPGTAASRGRPTTPRCWRCAPASSANFLTTLFLSQGTPMLLHGDELGAPSRATTTATAGQRDLLDRLGGRDQGCSSTRAW